MWQDACDLLRHPKLLRKEYERRLASPVDSSSQSSLKKHITAAQRSVDRLIDAYTDGVLARGEFDPRLERARQRLSKLKEQRAELETESREQSTLREALNCLDRFTASMESNLETADWTTRREVLHTLIDRVLIEKEQIRIVYRINFPLFEKKASTAVLPKRFGKYGLAVHPDKTQLIPFRRPPHNPPTSGNAVPPGTFDLLGFTHFWARSRKGVWVVKRKTASSRFTRALRTITEWCKTNCHLPIEGQHATLSQKLRGHYAYYGITGNCVA